MNLHVEEGHQHLYNNKLTYIDVSACGREPSTVVIVGLKSSTL